LPAAPSLDEKSISDCFLFWVLKQTRQVEVSDRHVPIGYRGGFDVSSFDAASVNPWSLILRIASTVNA
jgi:hypothetical protein